MAASFSYRRIIFLLWIFLQDAATEPVTVLTPRPQDNLDLGTCLHLAGDGSHADRTVPLLTEDGSMTSQAIDITGSSSECVESAVNPVQLDSDFSSESLCAQVVSASSTFHDAVLPLPTSCLGTRYVISTWTPSSSGTAFAAAFNPSSSQITVTVALDADLPLASVDADGVTVSPGSDITWQIPPYGTKYVTSSAFALDGVVISGQETFAVHAGNTDTVMFYIGVANHFLEQFPPDSFFHDHYFVSMPTELSVAMVKIVALTPGTTEVTTTTYDGAAAQRSTRILAHVGAVWTVSQRAGMLVESDVAVIVVQYCPDASMASSPSMTLFPPLSEWTSSYLVYPLADDSTLNTHALKIIARTNEATELTATSLPSNVDVTSSIDFTPIGQSEFSEASIFLTDVVWLLSTSGTRFQVMQYSVGTGSDFRAYSFHPGLHSTCLEILTTTNDDVISPMNLTTSATSSSMDDPDELFSVSDTWIYIAAGCAVLLLVIVILSLIIVHLAKQKRAKLTLGLSSSPSHVVQTACVEKRNVVKTQSLNQNYKRKHGRPVVVVASSFGHDKKPPWSPYSTKGYRIDVREAS